MTEGWWAITSFVAGCVGWALSRGIARVFTKRMPPRDTAEYLNRIAPVAHALIEARLATACYEAELANLVDNVPPVFEDQIMLAAQLGQSIEQSVMRSVQRQGIPIVRLSEERVVGYNGWLSKWLRRDGDVLTKPIPAMVVPTSPQLPEHAMSCGPVSNPPSVPSSPSTPTSVSHVAGSSASAAAKGPLLILRNGAWVPRKP